MATLHPILTPVQPGLPASEVAFAVGLARPARTRAPRGGCTVDGKFYRGGCFCPPFDAGNPHELPAVEIKGAAYLVESIPAGECGVSAVRLTKRSSHESYDVIRRHDDLVECDCPDFLYRHEGKGTTCKHGTACMVRGLLPVAPAPAPESNPRDSWPAWTDADRWTTEPPAPVEEGPAPSWDAERFEPEDVAAAYQLGYELGKAGEYPKAPAHFSGREAHHFGCGRLAGFIASEDGQSWYRDMETFEDRHAGPGEVHDSERAGVC